MVKLVTDSNEEPFWSQMFNSKVVWTQMLDSSGEVITERNDNRESYSCLPLVTGCLDSNVGLKGCLGSNVGLKWRGYDRKKRLK